MFVIADFTDYMESSTDTTLPEITQGMVDQDQKRIEDFDATVAWAKKITPSNVRAKGCHGKDDVVDALSKVGEACE